MPFESALFPLQKQVERQTLKLKLLNACVYG